MPEKTEPWPEHAPRPAFLTEDPQAILRFLVDAFAQGVGCGLVTLTEIRGGSARALGAQMAVRADGLFCGHVSGGCVEAAVAREVMNAIQEGHDRFLHLGEGSPFFDIRLACGGSIRLAIHVLRNDHAVRTILDCLSVRRPAALAYDARSQTLEAVIDQTQANWGEDGFVRPYRPPVRILLAGQPMELAAVSRIATAAGYETAEICTTKADMAMDTDTAIVLLYHDIDRELPLLMAALNSPAFYIGALGSARTHERRCAALMQHGVDQQSMNHIRAPIGLFPKARDAHTLALSIIADIAVARAAVVS
ncbi:xanthine dehydrogenase accessory factor [Agrobacterium vitis]|nr:xanthine dehydrogenase accessory factor [Agrobacterium vitis]MBE1437838.1 xanthine dehydrogenase accessory factor [Agrobacterium vitis]